MKKFICMIFGLSLFVSCDPDIPGEGINLPQMEFKLNVVPDTAYIKLGDTLNIYSSIPSKLSNGIKISNGNAMMDMFFGYCSETPVLTKNFESAKKDIHFKIIDVKKGGINIATNNNRVKEIYALAYEDSITLDISILPLKVGTYVMQVSSLFFEGTQGKTRTNPKFEVNDPNRWLNINPNTVHPDPSDEQYFKKYYFAVTE